LSPSANSSPGSSSAFGCDEQCVVAVQPKPSFAPYVQAPALQATGEAVCKERETRFEGCEIEAGVRLWMRDSGVVSNRFAYAVPTLDTTHRATPKPAPRRHARLFLAPTQAQPPTIPALVRGPVACRDWRRTASARRRAIADRRPRAHLEPLGRASIRPSRSCVYGNCTSADASTAFSDFSTACCAWKPRIASATPSTGSNDLTAKSSSRA
jgi:hypothetical protein